MHIYSRKATFPTVRAMAAAATLATAALWGFQPFNARADRVDSALHYTARNRGVVPIPGAEQTLQTVVAEPYFKVSDTSLQLEGAVFDKQGNLLFVEVFGGQLFKLTPDKNSAYCFQRAN